jgi:hypothetical protein
MPASGKLLRHYAIACGLVFALEVALFAILPIPDGPLGYPLLPGFWVASLLSLEGVDLSTAGIWFVFGLGFNALLYGAVLLLCWRGWRKPR